MVELGFKNTGACPKFKRGNLDIPSLFLNLYLIVKGFTHAKIKFSAVRKGEEAFPWNCQKTTLESTEMSSFGLLRQMREVLLVLLTAHFVGSRSLSPAGPCIRAWLWYQRTQQNPA